MKHIVKETAQQENSWTEMHTILISHFSTLKLKWYVAGPIQDPPNTLVIDLYI